jgi:hypothetical protein
MKVWVFEDNLIWSSRLMQTLQKLGHDAELLSSVPSSGSADMAILNLASPEFKQLVPELKERGVYSVGHAGHKEKDLLELGREAGCDAIATNSELTYKIERLLASVPQA